MRVNCSDGILLALRFNLTNSRSAQPCATGLPVGLPGTMSLQRDRFEPNGVVRESSMYLRPSENTGHAPQVEFLSLPEPYILPVGVYCRGVIEQLHRYMLPHASEMESCGALGFGCA